MSYLLHSAHGKNKPKENFDMSIEKQVFFSVMVLIVHFSFIHLFIVAVQTLAEGPLCLCIALGAGVQ